MDKVLKAAVYPDWHQAGVLGTFINFWHKTLAKWNSHGEEVTVSQNQTSRVISIMLQYCVSQQVVTPNTRRLMDLKQRPFPATWSELSKTHLEHFGPLIRQHYTSAMKYEGLIYLFFLFWSRVFCPTSRFVKSVFKVHSKVVQFIFFPPFISISTRYLLHACACWADPLYVLSYIP